LVIDLVENLVELLVTVQKLNLVELLATDLAADLVEL
jgi:hypothetical protein